MREPNIITSTDSYKVTHWKQYPPGTKKVFSFFESRGGIFPDVTFFGLQYILKEYFEGKVVTAQKIARAKSQFAAHFGTDTLFNEDGWQHILRRHEGRLPVLIKAVPEGMTVPVSNVLMTIENTDDEVPWLTNYLETLLSQVWYPSTVCTLSRANRRLILQFLEETGNPDLIDFKLHCFGFRGSTSVLSAGLGSLAHLVNFKGTDTFAAIDVAQDYYDEPMAGFSIPAAEHSTITSWGKENEGQAYENMLRSYPEGLVAVVSDSYDIFRACREVWGEKLREKVIGRNGVLVVRPDSGEPDKVVVQVLEILGEKFGYTWNTKGFKVLDPHIRVIQGDGIDHLMIRKVLSAMKDTWWSTDNIAFGSGGGLLQKVNRDDLKFAFKCSAILIGDTWHDVMKDPVTDHGKKSKAGRLVLVEEDGQLKTMREGETDKPNLLIPVFQDGEILTRHTLREIRKRAME